MTPEEMQARIARAPGYVRARAKSWADSPGDAIKHGAVPLSAINDASPLVRELFWTLWLEHIWGEHEQHGDPDCPYAHCAQRAKQDAQRIAAALADEKPGMGDYVPAEFGLPGPERF